MHMPTVWPRRVRDTPWGPLWSGSRPREPVSPFDCPLASPAVLLTLGTFSDAFLQGGARP